VLTNLREQGTCWSRPTTCSPPYALRGVARPADTIDDLLASVNLAARRQVLMLGAQYAESASWLVQDGCDLVSAIFGTTVRWNGHRKQRLLMLS